MTLGKIKYHELAHPCRLDISIILLQILPQELSPYVIQSFEERGMHLALVLEPTKLILTWTPPSHKKDDLDPTKSKDLEG